LKKKLTFCVFDLQDMDGEDDDLMAMMDDVPGVDEGDDGDGAKVRVGG
jgi:hypothetical protein